MNLKKSQRSLLAAIAGALVLGVVGLQAGIDPLRRQPAIEPPNVGNATKGLGGAALPFEYTLGAVSGFRQVIAGMLWVRADSFFHNGNYDAILPMIRLITWLDPNWLDPYATGAWHLTYNFTDTDQRSDRRYLPAGVGLLNEGIANNPDVYDMYKEKGWLYYDKIKDYNRSAEAYEGGMKHNPDLNQVGHALAHAYERAGRLDEAEAMWQKCINEHKRLMNDPKSSDEVKGRNKTGYDNAVKNLDLLQKRRKFRPNDTRVPVDQQFAFKVERVKPRVLKITGNWNVIGAKNFDDTKGIAVAGPVDGARVDVRLQNEGYKMPPPQQFNFETDPNITIMQDALSTRGGKQAVRGGLVVIDQKETTAELDNASVKAGVYRFTADQFKGKYIPLQQALSSGGLSPIGLQQLASIAYPKPFNDKKSLYDMTEVPGIIARLKAEPAKLNELVKKGYAVATADVLMPGAFKREIDMSKDPKMYTFTGDKYELILSFNPRYAPDFVKDRVGFNGEGLTDKRYLHIEKSDSGNPEVDKKTPDLRMIQVKIPLTREDITGSGDKVLAESK